MSAVYSGLNRCVAGRGVWLVCSVVLLANSPWGVQPASGEPVATVGSQTIDEVEVAARLRVLLAGRTLSGQQLALAQAQALTQLVNQELLRQYFVEHGPAATAAEIEVQLDGLRSQLAARQTTLDALLDQQGLTMDHLRRELELKVASAKYVSSNVTDEELQDFFAKNQQQFDDTLLRLSHILLRPEGTDPVTALENATQRAGELRERILAEEIGFAEAARRYSAGPSRRGGGDLGFLSRSGQGNEPFVEAAFSLQQGEISQPVVTPFGVHLITVTDSQPGGRDWTEVRDELLKRVGEQKLQSLIEQQREQTDVQFTGKMPYIRPGTTQLVIPSGQN